MMEGENEIDLKRFKKHQRKIPWHLIRKIIVAIVLIGLSIYLTKSIKGKKNPNTEIELDLK